MRILGLVAMSIVVAISPALGCPDINGDNQTTVEDLVTWSTQGSLAVPSIDQALRGCGTREVSLGCAFFAPAPWTSVCLYRGRFTNKHGGSNRCYREAVIGVVFLPGENGAIDQVALPVWYESDPYTDVPTLYYGSGDEHSLARIWGWFTDDPLDPIIEDAGKFSFGDGGQLLLDMRLDPDNPPYLDGCKLEFFDGDSLAGSLDHF